MDINQIKFNAYELDIIENDIFLKQRREIYKNSIYDISPIEAISYGMRYNAKK